LKVLLNWGLKRPHNFFLYRVGLAWRVGIEKYRRDLSFEETEKAVA
jgi:hypothetical protein